MRRCHTRESARGNIEFPGEILEFLPQLITLENLLKAWRLEFLDGLKRCRALANQVAELDAGLDRLVGIVGDLEIVRGLEASARDLFALLLQISAIGLCCLIGDLLAFAV